MVEKGSIDPFEEVLRWVPAISRYVEKKLKPEVSSKSFREGLTGEADEQREGCCI